MGKPEQTGAAQTQLLVDALNSSLSRESSKLTDQELAAFEADVHASKIPEATADVICEELAKYVKPEDPEAAKAFLRSFAVWVQRQRKLKAALDPAPTKVKQPSR